MSSFSHAPGVGGLEIFWPFFFSCLGGIALACPLRKQDIKPCRILNIIPGLAYKLWLGL
jgi:hypothetical protein